MCSGMSYLDLMISAEFDNLTAAIREHPEIIFGNYKREQRISEIENLEEQYRREK